MSSFLQKIYGLTEARVEERKRHLSLGQLEAQALSLGPNPLRFEHLFTREPAIIAEVKKSSPSQGSINQLIEPAELAGKYELAGAVAVSVLTEPTHFNGTIEDFMAVRARNQTLPLLQKDFVIGAYQIYEAKVLGANCVLLIVAMLEKKVLKELLHLAHSLDLSVLVETHHQAELEVALELGAKIIGVNNRDLHSLTISLDVSRKLADLIPQEVIAISESGIFKASEIQELLSYGYDGFLIGSSLMKEGSPDQALKKLILESR